MTDSKQAPSSSLAETSDNFVGRTLDDRYALVRRLGSGGMSSVYEGEHMTLGTKFAIKVLQSDLAVHERNRRRFLQEARAAASIRSPYIVEIYDFGVTGDGIVYFVMELLVGRDLAKFLKEEGPLPWVHAQPIALQIARGLAVAHAHGVIHRDIKPSNCFLLEEDQTDGLAPRVKLLDFGVAKLAKVDDNRFALEQSLTSAHEIVGTVGYIAPERLDGVPAAVSSDIYSLGVLMYRMLVGRLPYRGATPFQIFQQQARLDPPSPRQSNPAIPIAVENVILRALARCPQDRYPNVSEVLEDLERFSPSCLGVPALLDAPPLGHDASAAGSEHDDLLVTRTLDDSPPSAVVLETGGRTSRIQTWWLGGAGLVVVLGGALMLTPRSEAGRQDDLQEVASAEIDPDVQPVRPVSPVPASPPEVAPSENHVVHAAASSSSPKATAFPTVSPRTNKRSKGLPAKRPKARQEPVSTTTPPRVAATPTDITDAQSKQQIIASAKTHCSGSGNVQIRGAVGTTGRILSAHIRGADPSVRACIQTIVKAQKFAKGDARMVTFDMRL